MRTKLRVTRPGSASAAGPDAAAVLTKATRRAAEQLGLEGAVLADVLGVSASSVSRLGGGRTIDPDSAEGERALLFLRVYRGLDAVLGDLESCRRWLGAENRHLAGVPADLIRSAEGLVHVTRYLDAMRGKV
jgi:hypothetical protein